MMAYAMGIAGAKGMLRRMLYPAPNAFTSYLAIGLGGSIVMSVGFIAFLVNLVGTLGWANVLSLVVPERWLERRLEAEAAAV